MNTEKLEKLKKSLDNKFIPDNMKDKIRAEIKKLEADIKTDETITATEVKEEVKEIEKKVEKALEVAEEKEEKAEAKKEEVEAREEAKVEEKKEKESETKKPKSTKKSVFSVAKEIRKDNESWEDAKERARKIMKSETTETKKKTRTETDKLLAMVRRNKEYKKLAGTSNLAKDATRRALPRGKRVSENGNVYYENRANRVDVGGFKNAYLENGGYADKGVYVETLDEEIDLTDDGVVRARKTQEGKNLSFGELREKHGGTPEALAFDYGGKVGRYSILGEVDGEQPVLYATTDDKERIKPLVNMAEIDLYELTGKNHRIFVTDEVTDDEVYHYGNGGRTRERRYVNHSEDYEVRYSKNKPHRRGYGYEEGGSLEDDNFKRFMNAQISYIISLKTVSEKREPIENLLDNMEDYRSGSEIVKRITTDNLKYALRQKTVSKMNEVLRISLNALQYAEGGTITGIAETPLARGLDIDYTGLVGETGAMSEGEMFAMGGSLGNHGLKQGDQIIKTMSGGVQKVKTKSGDIVYVNLANGYRGSVPPLPFAKGGYTNERRHVNKAQDYEVRYAKNKPNRTGYLGKRSFDDGGEISSKQLDLGYQYSFEKDEDNVGSLYKEAGVYSVIGFENGKHFSESFEKFSDAKKFYLDKKGKVKFNDGGYMTDPNFGDFQNGVYATGGGVGEKYLVDGDRVLNTETNMYVDYDFETKERAEDFAKTKNDRIKKHGVDFATGGGVDDFKTYKDFYSSKYLDKKSEIDYVNAEAYIGSYKVPNTLLKGFISNFSTTLNFFKSVTDDNGNYVKEINPKVILKSFKEAIRQWGIRSNYFDNKYNDVAISFQKMMDKLYDVQDLSEIKIKLDNSRSGNNFATGGVTKNYIGRNELNTITIKKGDKKLTYKVSDVYNGAYKLEDGGNLERTAFYVSKRNVVKVQLKNGKDVKVANGYWIKKGAKPIHTSKYDDGGEMEYAGGGKTNELEIGQKYRDKNGNILTIKDFDIEDHVTTDDGKGKMSSIGIQRITVFKELIKDGELVLLNAGGGSTNKKIEINSEVEKIIEEIKSKGKYEKGKESVNAKGQKYRYDFYKLENPSYFLLKKIDSIQFKNYGQRTLSNSFDYRKLELTNNKDITIDRPTYKGQSSKFVTYRELVLLNAGGGDTKMVDGVMYEKVKFSNGIEDYYYSSDLHKVNSYCNEYGLNPKNQKDFEKAFSELKKQNKISYAGGGKTTFKEKATAIAKRFEGKKVEPKYQDEYGKTYDKAEAKEVGNKIAGAQKAKYDSKMSGGGKTKRGGSMQLAKEIRKDGESWQSALKRANEQLKK